MAQVLYTIWAMMNCQTDFLVFVLSNRILSSTPESSFVTLTAMEIYHVFHCSYTGVPTV